MKSNRRVVVTGLGALTSLGHNVKDTWKNIVSGISGVTSFDTFDTLSDPDISTYKTRFSARLQNFNFKDHGISDKEYKKMDAFIGYGMIASREAFKDSGIVVTEDNEHRIGVSVSSGIGGLTTIEKARQMLDNKGTRRLSPFVIPASIINMISGNVSIDLGLKGPNIAIVTACSTGTHNIGNAARIIAYGDADVMIAGGAEKSTTSVGISGFSAARTLSTRNDDPARASRPWDRDRDGFVSGDGAGVLVLEEYEHAVARGAKIYAEIVGFGYNADAYHMTSPSGVGAEKCMGLALSDAGLNVTDVDYINAHGTSTIIGDRMESQAVERLFGSHAKKLAISSTKSMIGHLLGAAGSIESIFSILSIQDQIAPPTINLDNVDDGCNLNYVAHESQTMKVDVALSNSFGFGGTNASLVFKKI